MPAPAHTDLTTFYSSPREIYAALLADQARDIRRHQWATTSLMVITGLAATGFVRHWDSAPVLAGAAAMALERAIWYGRELSNRNYAMHAITFDEAAKR